MLEAGFHDVPAGHVAAVVTHLEMRAPPAPRPERDGGWTLRHVTAPEPGWYRALFHTVGAADWLWFSRLVMGDAELAAILRDPAVEVHALIHDGAEAGLLELDFREAGACELAFFGLSRALIGAGAGRWMMNRALERAWAAPIARLTVHTCTLDHPAALDFYRRSGFEAVRRQIEIAPDPRLTGLLEESAAPQVPILR